MNRLKWQTFISIGTLALGCCKSSGNCCKKCNQSFGRNGLLDRGATNNEAIESIAFEVCDNDSDGGLTWEEVEGCEVSSIIMEN